MAENFRDTHYGEVFCIDYDVAACGAHLIAAHSKKFNIRYGLCEDSRPGLSKPERSSQRFDQLRAIHLSRRFARRNHYSHSSIVNSVDEYNRLWSDGRPRPPGRIPNGDYMRGEENPAQRKRQDSNSNSLKLR